MRAMRDSLWIRRPDAVALLSTLATTTRLTNGQLARKIRDTLNIDVTRNAVISKLKRLKLKRLEPLKAEPAKVRAPKAKVKVTPVEEMPPAVLDARQSHWPEPVSIGKVTITELTDDMCRWPMGKLLDGPPYEYCGHQVVRRNYCGHHAHLAYLEPKKRWS